MLGQSSLPSENPSLALQVEAHQAASMPCPDATTGRNTRIVWFLQGGALAIVLLIGVSVFAPLSSHASAQTASFVPEVAMATGNDGLNFAPPMPVANPTGYSNGPMRPAAVSFRKQQPISAPRMTGQGGEPMSRRATLLALTVPYVLAYTASPVLAYAGEGTMSKEEVVQAASKLTARQKAISLEAATEQPFTGMFVNDYPYSNEQEGTYVGAISGAPLFESSAKYDSKTGWPSFTSPIKGAVIERKDPEDLAKVWEKEDNANRNPFAARPKNSEIRIEVIDAVSGAHLGHVFDDGPSPGGKRYCMNAGAMAFIPKVDPEREKLKRLMNVDPAQELQGVAGKGVKTKITAGSGKFAGGR